MNNRSRLMATYGMAVALLLGVASLADSVGGAPEFDMAWWSIDGGGGASTDAGPEFFLTGSIGQPDAGTLSGGDFSLVGGVQAATEPTIVCAADTDGDGIVGITDFLAVLANWGLCPALCPQDVNDDGEVGIVDFLTVLAVWGPCS